MALQERNVMGDLLGVCAPWSVTDMRITDRGGRLISIQIEQIEVPGRFWTTRKTKPVLHWLRWAHIGVAGTRCEIVLALRDGQQVPSASWSGDIDAQFTRTLSRVAMDMLLEGATMDQLSRVLQVPFADLWKFKFRLDQGQTPAPAQLERRSTESAPLADDALPDVSDPLWLALLHGERELDVRALSLKLLLTKLRAQARGIHDDEVMMLKMGELHRFFERHQAVLLHEIAQLKRWSLH